MAECIFCDIAAGKVESEVVYVDDEVIAFRDLNPQAPVHILVVPKKHIPNLLELEGGDRELVARIHEVMNMLAERENLGERGFRVVVNCGDEGGQTVDHLHFHLLGGRRFTWPPG